MDGAIILNKPSGWTSHDAVNKMRCIARTKKVGHLGTLDPMATGVLPLLLNRATRLAQFFTRADKVYVATVLFGFATNTYDADGEASGPDTPAQFTREELESWLDQFRGTFQQTPPPVSAKKVAGTRAYKLARKNIPVDLQPVEVTITNLEVTRFAMPEVELLVECSAGTYVRSLAHDLGSLAGCGAHLSALVRTRSGDFKIEDAQTLEELESLAHDERFAEAMIPAASLLPEFPRETVDAVTATQIRQGRDFRTSPFRSRGDSKFVKAIGPDGYLIAIGQQLLPNVYHPIVVL